MGLKLLHTADLHLDRPFLGLGGRRIERRAEMRARFEEILGIAREREAGGLLIAGDLFDRPAAESGDWVRAHLTALAADGVRVFLIPGNHDPLESCGFYRGSFPPGVHVFKSPEFEACRDLPGVTIYGRAYHDAGRRGSPLAGLPMEDDGRRRIALVHGQLRSPGLFGEDYAPIQAEEITDCGLDYLALGHYHSYKDCSAGRTRAFYPGSPHRLDFGDRAGRCLLLLELDDAGVSVEPIPLADRQFLQIEGDAGRPEDLYDRLLKTAGQDTYVRVRLSGRPGITLAGLIADVREKFADRFYGLEIQAEDTAPQAVEARPGTVVHAFTGLAAKRLQESAGDEEREAARLAADYGLMALEGRQLP